MLFLLSSELFLAQEKFELGIKLYNEGKYEEARQEFAGLQKMLAYPKYVALGTFWEAKTLFKQKKFKESLLKFKKFRKKLLKYQKKLQPETELYITVLEFLTGKKRDISAEMERFREKYPDSKVVPLSYYYQIKSLLKNCKSDKAKSVLKEFEKEFPSNPYTLAAKYETLVDEKEKQMEQLKEELTQSSEEEKAELYQKIEELERENQLLKEKIEELLTP